MAAFRPFLKRRNPALAERSGNERHFAAPRVPKNSRSRIIALLLAWLIWETAVPIALAPVIAAEWRMIESVR
jgi:hypothetical protein